MKFFIRFFAALACLNASLTFGTEPDKNPECPADLSEILSSPPELLGLSLLDKLHFSPRGTDFFAPIGLNKEDAKIAQTLKAQFLYLAEQFDDSASADGTVPDSLLEATKVWASDMEIFLGRLGIPVENKGIYLELQNKGGSGTTQKFTSLFESQFPGKKIRISPAEFGLMEGAPADFLGEGSFYSTNNRALILSPETLVSSNRLFVLSLTDLLHPIVQIQITEENLARRSFRNSTYIDLIEDNGDRITGAHLRSVPLYFQRILHEIDGTEDATKRSRGLKIIEKEYSKAKKLGQQANDAFDKALISFHEISANVSDPTADSARLSWNENKTVLTLTIDAENSVGPLQLRFFNRRVHRSATKGETQLGIVLALEELEVFVPALDPNLNNIFNQIRNQSSFDWDEAEILKVISLNILPELENVLTASLAGWLKFSELMTKLEPILDPAFRAFGRPKLDSAQALLTNLEL